MKKLAAREKKLVFAGAIFVALLLIYSLIWSPISSLISNTKTDVQQKRATLSWMQHATTRIQDLRASGFVGQNIGDQSLLSFIQGSLQENNLNRFVNKLEQGNQQQIIIQLKKAPFDQLMIWLIKIWKKYAIEVQHAAINPDIKSGTVKAQLVLSK